MRRCTRRQRSVEELDEGGNRDGDLRHIQNDVLKESDSFDTGYRQSAAQVYHEKLFVGRAKRQMPRVHIYYLRQGQFKTRTRVEHVADGGIANTAARIMGNTEYPVQMS